MSEQEAADGLARLFDSRAWSVAVVRSGPEPDCAAAAFRDLAAAIVHDRAAAAGRDLAAATVHDRAAVTTDCSFAA